MKRISLLSAAFILALSSCNYSEKAKTAAQFPAVYADLETEAVHDADDAADDPAIWINPADPSASLLICSNKKSGIAVYDLQGNERAYYPVGLINNIDVRQGIRLNDSTRVDIAAGSNRTDNTITVMVIHRDGSLEDILNSKIQSAFAEVYGFCLYHDLSSETVYAIVNNKEGFVEQWRLFSPDGQKLEGELARSFRAGQTQLEGCVGDDELGFLYIGEEGKGIWKYPAHPDSSQNGRLVDDLASPYLEADIEGLTIYATGTGTGYLIASSQGNNSFAVYRREGANEYLGSFIIADGDVIDGVSETDGIDVTNVNLGPAFPNGLFIAQDGYNYEGEKQLNQNFKVVAWEKIAEAMKLN